MSLIHSPNIVRSGLILYLDAANIKSYPGSGTTWYDLSGNNINGTLINGPTFDPTNNGNFIFDGVNDYVNLNMEFTQSSSAYSYTVVIASKLSSISSARRQLWSSDNGSYDWGFGSGDGSKFTIFSGGGLHQGRDQDLNWHVFSAQWSVAGTKLYIDGLLDISTTIDYESSVSTTTSIGRNPGFGEYFNGNISIVQVYNRALSTTEITQNFNALRGRYGI